MIKVSVIIPVYNAESYLQETLDSVLNQSLKEIEVICVDDGSTDSSPTILSAFAEKDSRVKVISQQNGHAGVARNAGLAVAQGEYVHFLDADDYVLDYAYEALYNKVVKYDLDMVKFASHVWNVEHGAYLDHPSFTLNKLRPGDFNRLLDLSEGSPMLKVNVAPWNGLYRRSFLLENKITFNDLFCVNDRSFFVACITNAARMMVARDRLVIHRTGLSSSLIGLRAANFDCHFRSIQIIEDRLVRDGVDSELAMRLMRKEFRDLLDWTRSFALDEEFGQQILERVESFAANYQGQYAYLLQDMLWNDRKNIAQGPKPFNVKKIPLTHKRCENPKVSVVVPTFNVEDYLNEALFSLYSQTLEEMEFLVVNDGSTDNSLTIIKEYAAIDARFVILDGPNGGYGKAMNRGINAARGEFIGILEPDDFVPATMFKDLYERASKHQLDFVKADFNRFVVNPDGSLKNKLNRLGNKKELYNVVLKPGDHIETFKFIMNTWSGIYSLDFLNKWGIRHNETPGASYQDNGFWFQTFIHAERAMFVDKPYYMNRRDNPNSSMFNKGKVFCVTNEYKYIWEKLSQHPEKLEKFAPIFYVKKFANFMVTYRRLSREYQQDYLIHTRDEFAPALEAGLIDRELIGENYWKQLHEIVADPVAYHQKLRVSVIMPVYNAEKYIHQTMLGLLVRNEIQFELICVDDGSTDNTLEILREYEAKDDRVHVYTKPNGGAGAARNFGMQYAKGEYLSFLDADDFFEPDMLRLAYDRAHSNDADISVFRCDQYFEETGTYAPCSYTIRSELLPAVQPFAGSDLKRDVFKVFVGWAWDKLFRADFVRENGLKFQEQRTSNDMLFVFSAIVKAESIVTLNAILAHHRRDAGSLSVTREQSWPCFYHALMALRQQLIDWDLYQRFERDFINYACHFTLWNVTTLRGESYYKLVKALQDGWAADLGLTGKPSTYFYNQSEYKNMMTLLSSSAEDFLFDQLDSAKNSAASLRSQVNTKTKAVTDRDKKIKRLEERLADHKRSIAKLKRDLKAANKKLKKTKSSMIWKVGRIVTWLPRKLLKLVKGK